MRKSGKTMGRAVRETELVRKEAGSGSARGGELGGEIKDMPRLKTFGMKVGRVLPVCRPRNSKNKKNRTNREQRNGALFRPAARE